MERDIDDLLDEVETKFMNNPTRKSAGVPSLAREKQHGNTVKASMSARISSNPLDEVIDDILEIDVSEEHYVNSNMCCRDQHHLRPIATEVTSQSGDQIRRCFPLLLGGSADNMGRSSTTSNKACDQLRCTSCDFRVCIFDNLSWNQDTDYLFLRNNVPNFHKLKSQLHRRKGCRAYCCQCSWRNVFELSELKDPALKWVCGRHTS